MAEVTDPQYVSHQMPRVQRESSTGMAAGASIVGAGRDLEQLGGQNELPVGPRPSCGTIATELAAIPDDWQDLRNYFSPNFASIKAVATGAPISLARLSATEAALRKFLITPLSSPAFADF